MVLERRGDRSLILARVYGGEREKRRREKKRRKKEEEKKKKIQVWNLNGIVTPHFPGVFFFFFLTVSMNSAHEQYSNSVQHNAFCLVCHTHSCAHDVCAVARIVRAVAHSVTRPMRCEAPITRGFFFLFFNSAHE